MQPCAFATVLVRPRFVNTDSPDLDIQCSSVRGQPRSCIIPFCGCCVNKVLDSSDPKVNSRDPVPSHGPPHMPIDHEAQGCMCLTLHTTHYALGCIHSNSRGLVPRSRSTVTIASSPPRQLPSSVQVARHPTTASSDQYRAIRQREYKSRTRNMARVYADINAQMPRAYWDYDSVNISWGLLENYEVVRKIGTCQAEPGILH